MANISLTPSQQATYDAGVAKYKTGGLAANGAVPKNTSGVLSSSYSPMGAMNSGQGSTNPISLGTNNGLISPHPTTTPTTPAKKVTTTDTMGNVTSTEYHAPTPQASYDTKTGFLSDYGKSIGAKAVQQGDPLYSAPETKNSNAPVGSTVGTQIQNVANTGQQTPQEQQTYSGLMNQSQNASPEYIAAQAEANRINQQMEAAKTQFAKQTSDINQSGTWTSRALGEQGQANIQNAATLSALGSQYQGATNQVGQANTQQGLQVQAGTAANTAAQTQAGRATGTAESVLGAVAPNYPGYNTPIVQPGMLGNTNTGTTGTAMSQLPQQAQTAIQSYAQQVQSGAMTRADAESRLSAYGIAGTNALNEALGSSFNTNASNASAGTTAVGQQVQAAIKPANQALDLLQTAFNNLPGIEASGFSAMNGFLQNLSMQTGIGRKAASDYQGALAEARARINGVLTSIIGVDAATQQANTLLPDNMTPEEIPGKIVAAKTYMQNQLDSYLTSGSQNGTSTNSGGGGYAEVW